MQEHIHSLGPVVHKQFGAGLSTVIFTTAEFVRGVKSKKPPIYDIVKEGKVIAGKTLREIVRG